MPGRAPLTHVPEDARGTFCRAPLCRTGRRARYGSRRRLRMHVRSRPAHNSPASGAADPRATCRCVCCDAHAAGAHNARTARSRRPGPLRTRTSPGSTGWPAGCVRRDDRRPDKRRVHPRRRWLASRTQCSRPTECWRITAGGDGLPPQLEARSWRSRQDDSTSTSLRRRPAS
jgi:hypothetical protein